jgi:hypothetical protein
LVLSKTQVDKLGDRLRRADVPTDDDLRLLSDFREERRDVMDAVGAGLAEIVGSVPARRLKTINSIVDKLRRESARLSRTTWSSRSWRASPTPRSPTAALGPATVTEPCT